MQCGKEYAKSIERIKKYPKQKSKIQNCYCINIEWQGFFFEGVVNGTILEEKKGSDGFGYDPIFRPNGYEKTFAQMSIALKNKISHRGIAVKKLVVFLNQEELG